MKTNNKQRCHIGIFFLVVLLSAISFGWQQRFLDLSLPIDHQILSSFGSFVSAITLLFTLYYAYKTYNESIKNQVERRFFQLLEIITNTRNDLLERDMSLFENYIRHIKVFYQSIEEHSKDVRKKWTSIDMLKLAYLLTYFGVEKINKKLLANIHTINHTDIDSLIDKLNNKGYKLEYPANMNLGVYFRQLFQAVSYVNESKCLQYVEKAQLVKSLRVTLSLNEQYLLFVISLTNLGAKWEKNQTDINFQLITKYNLIKNLPKNFQPISGFEFDDALYGYPNVDYEHCAGNKTEIRKKLEEKYS